MKYIFKIKIEKKISIYFIFDIKKRKFKNIFEEYFIFKSYKYLLIYL